MPTDHERQADQPEMLPAVVAMARVLHELSVRVTGGGFTVPIEKPDETVEFDSRSCPPGKVKFYSDLSGFQIQ